MNLTLSNFYSFFFSFEPLPYHTHPFLHLPFREKKNLIVLNFHYLKKQLFLSFIFEIIPRQFSVKCHKCRIDGKSYIFSANTILIPDVIVYLRNATCNFVFFFHVEHTCISFLLEMCFASFKFKNNKQLFSGNHVNVNHWFL